MSHCPQQNIGLLVGPGEFHPPTPTPDSIIQMLIKATRKRKTKMEDEQRQPGLAKAN